MPKPMWAGALTSVSKQQQQEQRRNALFLFLFLGISCDNIEKTIYLNLT